MDQYAGELGSIVYVVTGGYLLLLLVFGVVAYLRSSDSEEDYYLASRGQNWVVSSLTIMATFFSAFGMLSAPGMVYREGAVFILFSLNVPLAGAAVYVLGSRIARAGRARGYVTPADMISDYYQSPVALRLLVALVGVLYATPYVVMQIRAGGIVSEQLFPGEYSYEIGAIVLAIVTMFYIMIGGMRSVAWTDVVQGTLLIGGMLLIGAAVVIAMGGVSKFFAEVTSQLPPEALTAPGTTGRYTPLMLCSVCTMAALGSMVHPAQWMRFYAAKSTNTLRQTAIIFTIVLSCCYLFGVMLIGLAGWVLYPPIQPGVIPHPDVGTTKDTFDQVMVLILKTHLPEMWGTTGAVFSSLILVSVLAASMSTADSNLHGLSAVLTRDVYDRFVRPNAGQTERTWVGRAVIAIATLIALGMVMISRLPGAVFDPIKMIVELGMLAIAFSVQLLPLTVDMLYLRRGSKLGAVVGIVAGLVVVMALSPAGAVFYSASPSGQQNFHQYFNGLMDRGAIALLVNIAAFLLVSLFTRRPQGDQVEELGRIMEGK